MSTDAYRPAAVPGLNRSDPHGPGITRERIGDGFRYHDPSGAEITSPGILHRIGALGNAWRPLRSHEVSSYIADRAGGHFTAKEFRTWNATVLMALLLANADPAPTARRRKSIVTAAVRGVADQLGDTPAVARASYIDPRVIDRYTSDGQLTAVPRLPALLPAAGEAEIAVAALLAGDVETSAADRPGQDGFT